jgi:hypothetical protein
MNDVAGLDWERIEADLDQDGFALLPQLLHSDEARNLAEAVSDMLAQARPERPLPAPLADCCPVFYEKLVPLADRWSRLLGAAAAYPATLAAFQEESRQAGQTGPHAMPSCLHEGEYEALHQHAAGEPVFPLQMVALLSAPGEDFTGGEFVMTEQRPRMQSRPLVLPLGLGDAAIIAAGPRPFKGSRGYYRVNSRHATSRVRSGERIGLDILFQGTGGPSA